LKHYHIIIDNANEEDALHLLNEAIKLVKEGVTDCSCHPNSYIPYLYMSAKDVNPDEIANRKKEWGD